LVANRMLIVNLLDGGDNKRLLINLSLYTKDFYCPVEKCTYPRINDV